MSKHIRMEVTTKDGNKATITASPAMSDKTYNALMALIDVATKAVESGAIDDEADTGEK